MKQHKEWPPLSVEEEKEICKKCGGFCCKFYFYNAQNNKDALDLHKFRERKIIKYGTQLGLILSDRCPWADDENQVCAKYETVPRLCRSFPESYRPFWNLKCKLMRERYKRGLIPKDYKAFEVVSGKKKTVFRVLKP